MTLLRTEGFDWLETADLPTAYSAWSPFDEGAGPPTVTIEEAGGRNGDKSIKIVCTSGTAEVQDIQGIAIPIPSIPSGSEVIFGFAVKFNVVSETDVTVGLLKSGGASRAMSNLIISRDLTGVLKCGTAHQSLGNLVGYAGGIGATVLSIGVWYFVEVKYLAHNTTGYITLRVNGVNEFALTSLDTIIKPETDNISLVLGPNDSSTTLPNVEYDDVYICDDLGSVNNDFLGDVQIKALFPNGNGTTSNFTGSDADSTDNYLHVDDGPAPDDDASYVEDNVSTNKDLYTFDNLPVAAASVLGVTVRTLGKKVDVGAADLKNVVRSSTTESDSADLGMGTSYTAKQTVYEQDPDTATAWTTSGVDAMEAGIKVV